MKVENMINQLKYGMKELINENNWMDAATKIVAREKVKKISYIFGVNNKVRYHG